MPAGISPIKFAIIGCGRIAWRHAEQIQYFGKLTAVCDIEFGKATQLASQYAAKAYPSVEMMLAAETHIQVAVICTPNGLHAFHSILCLEAGMHVLVEKPMAILPDDGRAMIEASLKAQKYLWVVHQNRYNPPVVALKKALDAKAFGTIFNVQINCFWNRNPDYYADSWRGTLEMDGGTLFTQFSHFIDLLCWFFGEASVISAHSYNFAHKDCIAFEDAGMVQLDFQNGIVGSVNYHVNSFKQNMEGSLTVFGEKGTLKIGGQYLNSLEYQCMDNYTIGEIAKGNPANDYGNYTGSMSNHYFEYQNLITALQNDKPDMLNAQEGLKTVELISQIYQSAKKHF